MGAREDYPNVEWTDESDLMFNEIDRLRRWKAEATTSLEDWHALEGVVPAEFVADKLGKPWPNVIEANVWRLMTERDAAEADADRLAAHLTHYVGEGKSYVLDVLHADAVAKRGPR